MPEFKALDPVKVFDGVWNITPGMSNSYLVVGNDSALMIDTGIGRDDMLEQIAKLTDKPLTLVTTHMHGDHTGGHKHFPKYGMHTKDHAALNPPLAGEWFEVKEGDKFDLGGRTLEAVELRGHTPGSVGYLDRLNGLFFTGDMVSSGTIFMIDGQCDFNDFIKSMDKLAGFADTVDYLVTCHGEPNTLPVSHAAKQKAAAEAFLAGKLKKGEGNGHMPGNTYVTEEGLGFFRP